MAHLQVGYVNSNLHASSSHFSTTSLQLNTHQGQTILSTCSLSPIQLTKTLLFPTRRLLARHHHSTPHHVLCRRPVFPVPCLSRPCLFLVITVIRWSSPTDHPKINSKLKQPCPSSTPERNNKINKSRREQQNDKTTIVSSISKKLHPVGHPCPV